MSAHAFYGLMLAKECNSMAQDHEYVFDIYNGTGAQVEAHKREHLEERLSQQPLFLQERGHYLADEGLVDAVNTMLCLGQPLLVTGEPGCGKTVLAHSVAHELSLDAPLIFHTRSNSKAQDLLYTFDVTRRFYDVQQKDDRAKEPRNYISYGPLGQAITGKLQELDETPEPKRKPSLVLIDEIDKAPRDFPNDLLHELDKMEFEIDELSGENKKKASQVRPIVIITSNSERQLPLPFLRRCVFYHIEFPDPQKLYLIAMERLGYLELDEPFVKVAIDRFGEVRALANLYKKPATGELLMWLRAMKRKQVTLKMLQEAKDKLGKLPLPQALLKDRNDLDLISQKR